MCNCSLDDLNQPFDDNLDCPRCIPFRSKSLVRLTGNHDLEGHVLVLYMGGTIGMNRNKAGVLVPQPNALVKSLRNYPQMHDQAYASKNFGDNGPLVLPVTTGKRRVVYTVMEYEKLIDSSNVSVSDWINIAKDIEKYYTEYDGFVVLHGTDTLSYTASALSFLLDSLGKTVIVTGSQIPIFELRSDGFDNFLTSLLIAGNYNIPEVCVFFASQLLRGNRTSKKTTDTFKAFESPNFPPLAIAGISIDVDYRSIFRPQTLTKFNVHDRLCEEVTMLRLFPGITTAIIKAALQPPTKGMILQTYGAGNVPTNREDIFDAFREAVRQGVIVINITQCSKGTVNAIYETGMALKDAGVISGFDMTPEAAYTKLAYVLSKTEWDQHQKIAMMETNLRGELTKEKPSGHRTNDLLDIVARSLNVTSPSELHRLRNNLFPGLLASAVMEGDIEKLKTMKEYGSDFCETNADSRTALHVACSEGCLKVVRYLLENGASVHIRDRFDRTPLMDAIENDHHEVVKLLIQCGAHISDRDRKIGQQLCLTAAAGNLQRIISYHLAGVNLSEEDISGRNALHMAALHGHKDIVKFLMHHDVDANTRDMIGHTPADLVELISKARIQQS